VYFNNLYFNRFEMPDGTGGGQLFLAPVEGQWPTQEPASQNAIIAQNVIDGNTGQQAQV
jgi:hypothetical protein